MKLKIEYVSTFGGIKHQDKWINPAKDSRIKFTQEDIGKEIELILNEEGKYRDYIEKEVSETREVLMKELAKPSFDAKSLDIHRQVALKCAVDYLKDKNVSTHNLMETAEDLEKWLNR